MATHISNTLKNMILNGQVVRNGETFHIHGSLMGSGGTIPARPSYTERLFAMLANALGSELNYRSEWVPPLPCAFYVTELHYEKTIMVVLEINGKSMRLEDPQEKFPSNELIGKIRLLSP